MGKSNEAITQNSTPPSDTVNVASIGLGSMGGVNIRTASSAGARIAALCDVDESRLARYHELFPDARSIRTTASYWRKRRGSTRLLYRPLIIRTP